MEAPTNTLLITYVEKEGPFLKVWGQTDKTMSNYVDQVLATYAPQFDGGLGASHPESLQVGILCCAKYRDHKYFRTRITSLSFMINGYVEVFFVDHGHKDIVPIQDIRSLEGFDTCFLSVPHQAASFILAEAVCPKGEGSDILLDQICKEIRYSEVNFSIIAQVVRFYLVRLFVGTNDLAIVLITKGLMRHTSLTTQEAVLLTRPDVQQPAMQNSMVTYKAYSLDAGRQYEVYVSYVTDGPCNFSVQLKQYEDALGRLMKEINSMNLTPIEGVPIPGTVCLSRCMEDGHICRAVVTSEVDGRFKVFYVDFGNYEVVSVESLYEIPFKYVIPKAMAIRFALAGIEKSTVTLEMKCAFKQFVDNRLIFMKVLPMTSRTSLQRCELWDPENNVSASDVINQAASFAYPEIVPLGRGTAMPVKVSYVFSCNRFYVQPKAKQQDLLRVMLDIQAICRDLAPINPDLVKKGLPCFALFEADQQWYRSQVVELLGDGSARVQYVDYGNEEVVPVAVLKPIEGPQLMALRPQALECCLNGYQNMEPEIERDNLLEELVLEKDFTLKVIEMQGKKALVELIDASNYNVASLLLDKIAATRSQVSPMLVQAGNKIEHRKSQASNRQEQQQRGRPDRTRNDFETNGSPENSNWKQNNRSFNKNFDRNKRDDLSDSNDSDRQSNKGFNRNNDRNRNDMNSRNADGNTWRQNNDQKQDRYNRNSDWNGDDKKNFNQRDRDENNRRNFNSKDDWSENRDANKRSFRSRDNDNKWGGRDNEKRNYNSSRDDNSWDDPGRKKDHQDGWESGNKKQSNWGDGRGDSEYKKQDTWGDSSQKKERDNWGGRDDRRFGNRDRDNSRNNRDRSNDEKDSWSGGFDSSQKSGGFRKKSDFKRETSELSSSGSEKSFRKGGGFRDNRGGKPGGSHKKFDSSPKFGDGGGDTWSVGGGGSPNAEVPNAAPPTAEFRTLNVNDTDCNVVICWFHNPTHFYCQMENMQDEFKKMMGDIQHAYKGRPAGTAAIGAPVVGLFPEDRVLYRAKVLDSLGSQYKIYYVDFGNVSLVEKVWPIEKRFMELPAQALCCKLDAIEPAAESWPDAGSYGQYFDKKHFTCKFVSTQNNIVSVRLEHEGEDVGSALVRDGLAQTAATPPPVDTLLLIGQQFRAMLIDLIDLENFTMLLQCGVQLKCGIYNFAESTETWEDNLREKMEQILIVYVDDAKEDKLEVTLYDQTGAKIKLINKDEEAYETVELLCPYLILYSSLSGEVVHANDQTIYIQPSDCAQTVEWLLNTMFEAYDTTILENPIVPVEGYVYAVRGSDANWYRGRVVSFDDSKAEVNYVDYGNAESVEFGALRELTADFMEVQTMSVAVTVTVPTENLIGQSVTVDIVFTETGIEGTIREEQTPPVPPETVTETPEAIRKAPSENVVPQPGTGVVRSHTDSPGEFYLQLAESITAIEELQANLQEQIGEMAEMENPVVGVLCAAPYSLDQQWYRALILDADSDITTVRFVDYGHTDVLSNETTKVKTLPPHLLALEVYATRCSLKVKPVENEWTSAASERFERLCDVETLTARFVGQDEKTNYVELYANGAEVGETLVREDLARPDEEAVVEAKSVGFVSHLNSPSEFWIQLENCVDELEWVAEQLSAAESFPELEDLAPGTLCAALFPDDQMWYRARILSNTIAGIEVLFVDYGNSCTSCSLRELPEELVMVAPLAQKCSLRKPEGLTGWGPEMVRRFAEISADGQTTFGVKKLSTGETASVELSLDGVDVTQMLLPKTEEVRVKSFAGFDELVLTRNEEELGVFALEALKDVTWNDESSKKFAEMIDNESVFQAEFVSDNVVRLYSGLNDVRLVLSGVKTATPTSSPSKSRPEIVHSIEENDEIKDIVSGIIESSMPETSEEVAEEIVSVIVSQSVHSDEVSDNESTSREEDTAKEIDALVDEIVQAVTENEQLVKESPSKSSDATLTPERSPEKLDTTAESCNEVLDETALSSDDSVNSAKTSPESCNEVLDESALSSDDSVNSAKTSPEIHSSEQIEEEVVSSEVSPKKETEIEEDASKKNLDTVDKTDQEKVKPEKIEPKDDCSELKIEDSEQKGDN